MYYQNKRRDWFRLASEDGRTNDKELLYAHEAARLCGVDMAGWWAMVKCGLAPAGVKIGGKMMWRREELHKQTRDYGLPGTTKNREWE